MTQTTQQDQTTTRQLLWLLKHYPTDQLQDPGIHEEYYQLYTLLERYLRDQGVAIGTEEGHDEEVEWAADAVYDVPFDRALRDRLDLMAQTDPDQFLTWFRQHGG